MPSRTEDLQGMPMTGSVVPAAMTPARWAAMPAAAMITPKPFAFAELVARVRALSRRSQKLTELTHFTYHDLEVDVQLHQAKRKGQVLDLTAREFALLLLFMQSPERLITRTAILEQVWEMNFDPGTNILDVHMSHLRKKLDEGSKVKLLQTVRGIGYMLKAVEEKDTKDSKL